MAPKILSMFAAEANWMIHGAHAILRYEKNVLNRFVWACVALAVCIPLMPVMFVLGIIFSPVLFLIAGFVLMVRIHDAPRFRGAPHRRIEGYALPAWEPVRDQFAVNITSGNDLGASVCVYRKGKKVVDVSGGSRGVESNQEFYDADTLNMIYSSTKFVESLVIAMLVDRGHLEYDKPIAHYWPEFAANGKELIEVQELMRHAAGLSTLDRMIELDELWPENNDKFGQYLASVKPIFKKRAGRKMPTGYHGLTRGFYANQLCRRVDPKGRDLRTFALEEICEPLGIDFYIGLHDDKDFDALKRKANIVLQPPSVLFFSIIPQLAVPAKFYMPFINNPYHKVPRLVKQIVLQAIWSGSNTQTTRALLGVIKVHPKEMNSSNWLRGLSPSANGYSNARALARISAVLANGGSMDGVTLLSPTGMKKALETDGKHMCRVLHTEIEFTRCGWAYFEEELNGCYGWGGFGGSMVLFQPDLKFSYSYVMNAIGTAALGDHRGISCFSNAILIADAKQTAEDDKAGHSEYTARRISIKPVVW
eukprot:Clim_evm12s236 gene=Clim_evmTU12s236